MSEDELEESNKKLQFDKNELMQVIKQLDKISPDNSDDDIEMVIEDQYDKQEYFVFQLQQKEDASSSLDQISVKQLDSIFIKFCKVSFNMDGLSQDRSFSLFEEGLFFEDQLVSFKGLNEDEILSIQTISQIGQSYLV